MKLQTAIKGLAVAGALALASAATPASAVSNIVHLNSASMDTTYWATINYGPNNSITETAYSNGVTFNVTNTTGSTNAQGNVINAVGATYNLFAFCIDVYHNMTLGALNDYYESTYGNEPNPNPIFNGAPGPGTLTTGQRNAITNLADIGFILNRDKTNATAADVSRRTAAIQAAIWSIEGNNVSLVNGGNGATPGTYQNYYDYYRGLNFTSEARIFTLTDVDYAPGGDSEHNHQGFIVGWPPEGGVPEPATWAMMIMGFGAAGVVLRRRQAPVRA